MALLTCISREGKGRSPHRVAGHRTAGSPGTYCPADRVLTVAAGGKKCGLTRFMARRIHSIWAVLILVLALFGQHASAQTGKLGEYEIKAAFLYHFANYTEWPDEAFADKNAPFTFGIFGENPFSDILNGFTNKFVRERPVRIIKCSSWDEARDCHLLFIGSSEKNKLTEILAHLKTRSILTVADTDSFLESGGIIHLIT